MFEYVKRIRRNDFIRTEVSVLFRLLDTNLCDLTERRNLPWARNYVNLNAIRYLCWARFDNDNVIISNHGCHNTKTYFFPYEKRTNLQFKLP